MHRAGPGRRRRDPRLVVAEERRQRDLTPEFVTESQSLLTDQGHSDGLPGSRVALQHRQPSFYPAFRRRSAINWLRLLPSSFAST